MKSTRFLTVAAVAMALAGCAAVPEFLRPQVETPATWRGPARADASLADLSWAEAFKNPELTELINIALENNHDLRIAGERIELARARYGFERSFLFPSLLADGAYTRARQPVASSATENRIGSTASLGLAVPTWEIDLWGRVRAATEAARRDLQANVELSQAAQVSLVAQVALTYLDLIELDAELDIARRTRASRGESLRLVNARFEGEITSAIDVRQAESLLATADQSVADIERRRALTENALALLLGRNPGPIARSQRLGEQALAPELPAGLPSTLLERRPDILAAEQALAATEANVEAARKAFFPTISLTAFLGFASPELSQLFDGERRAWSISPAITAPIFTAGRIRSNLEAAQAQQRIALETYVSTVQNAFREVEDALVGHQRLGEQRAALERVVTADRDRLRLATLRYNGGVASYFEVLDSERQLFDSELRLTQAIRATHASVVQLYRALGGGWLSASAAPQASVQ
jgi:outer membrane protein, multidrug efflux system